MILPKPIKLKVERYIGGLSIFKKIDNPIKLSANESALGPSPRAIEAFEREKTKFLNIQNLNLLHCEILYLKNLILILRELFVEQAQIRYLI